MVELCIVVGLHGVFLVYYVVCYGGVQCVVVGICLGSNLDSIPSCICSIRCRDGIVQ